MPAVCFNSLHNPVFWTCISPTPEVLSPRLCHTWLGSTFSFIPIFFFILFLFFMTAVLFVYFFCLFLRTFTISTAAQFSVFLNILVIWLCLCKRCKECVLHCPDFPRFLIFFFYLLGSWFCTVRMQGVRSQSWDRAATSIPSEGLHLLTRSNLTAFHITATLKDKIEEAFYKQLVKISWLQALVFPGGFQPPKHVVWRQHSSVQAIQETSWLLKGIF